MVAQVSSKDIIAHVCAAKDSHMPTATTTLIERPHPAAAAAKLRAAGLGELLADLYASRGITDISEVRGRYEDLLPIDTLKNAREMASFLADCVITQQRVLIVSDYDCDGATACSVLLMAFGGCGMNHGYLVPDREKHGYGLTTSIVDDAAALEPRPAVIITVDNGISSVEGVARAKALGIEVLVTDHHLAPPVLPDAALIVNPNQPGCGRNGAAADTANERDDRPRRRSARARSTSRRHRPLASISGSASYPG